MTEEERLAARPVTLREFVGFTGRRAGLTLFLFGYAWIASSFVLLQ